MKWAVLAFFLGAIIHHVPYIGRFFRPTLRACQRWGALGGVKTLRSLTLSCQKINPDGFFEPDGVGGGIAWNMGWGC